MSRIASAVASTPRAAASRRARTQASGEFHAASRRPSTRSVDLALVVGVEDEVEVEVLASQPGPEPLPDGHDLRVVRHGPHHQRLAHAEGPSRRGRSHSARPMKSNRASVVGAMTSRGLRVAEPPLDAELLAERRAAADPHALLGDADRGFAGRRLHLQHAQLCVRPARADRGERVADQRVDGCRCRPASGRRRPGERLLRQGLVEVLESGARSGGAPVSATTPRIMPRLAAALRTGTTAGRRSSAMSSPAPSSPSRADSGMTQSRAVIGLDPLPRRPSPSKGPATSRPGVELGTSQSVIGPAGGGTAGSTRHSCRPRRPTVTQLFCASRCTCVAVELGAALRRPEVAATPDFGEGERREVPAGADLGADGLGAVGLDHRGRGVVHRARPSRWSRTARRGWRRRVRPRRGPARRRPPTLRRHQPEDPRLAEGVEGRPGERPVPVDVPALGATTSSITRASASW